MSGHWYITIPLCILVYFIDNNNDNTISLLSSDHQAVDTGIWTYKSISAYNDYGGLEVKLSSEIAEKTEIRILLDT